MTKTSLILVDDHQIVLDGLQMLLNTQEGIEIRGTALNSQQAMELLHSVSADIIIIDISMPGENGIDFTRHAKKLFPDLKFIALSMLNDYTSIHDMLEAGADAYILKNTSSSELMKAISEVMSDGSYISPEINNILLEGMRLKKQQGPSLTEREKEVLKFIVEGHSSKQIAGMMNVTTDTIKFHRKNILFKLGQPNAAAMVKYAIDHRLL